MKKLLIIFLLLNSSIILAKVPQFSDYPAPVFKGKNAAMQLNENTKNYRTRFGYLKNEKPNFAGHYVIDFFGCGTSCIIGIAFNVRNGATQFLPSGALTACYKEASLPIIKSITGRIAVSLLLLAVMIMMKAALPNTL